MVPTLVSTWRKMRANEKSGLHGYRSQSEVITGVRLLALSTTAVAQPRSRASSVELSSSRATIEEHEDFEAATTDSVRLCTRGDSAVSHLQLKVYVGSWNMAAKDPFASAKGSTTYVGDAAAAEKLKPLLPPGYDLYVIGSQEKVTKHLHAAVLARLHSAPENLGRRFVILRQISRQGRRRAGSGSSNSPSGTRASESSGSNNSGQFDRYRHGSFALEASDSLNTHPRPQPETNQSEEQNRESIKEVRGRGDGAFLNPKSTSIAIYCASDLEGVVEIEKIATHKFSWSSGSKGGVAVMLSVATSDRPGAPRQTLTFANCHLEANKPALRRQQLSTLSTKLGQALGNDAKDLASSSDHVVWMGDFNYRIHTLDGETVLKLLTSGKHLEVHDRYDTMKDDLAMVSTMESFSEPNKWPTFYPTYKKIPGRPDVLDASDPNWATSVYRVLYKEPFYKGGKVKARVPGWCDRILYCSRGGLRHLSSWLDVEQIDSRDNYRAVNNGFCESDHSPVFCTFEWTIATTNTLTWG